MTNRSKGKSDRNAWRRAVRWKANPVRLVKVPGSKGRMLAELKEWDEGMRPWITDAHIAAAKDRVNKANGVQ